MSEMNQEKSTRVPNESETSGVDGARQLREPTAVYEAALPTTQAVEAESDPFMEAAEIVLLRHAEAWKALAK